MGKVTFVKVSVWLTPYPAAQKRSSLMVLLGLQGRAAGAAEAGCT